MKYRSGAEFRAALEARLRNVAGERGQPVGRLRKAVVFDRLLARLQAVAAGRWVLKGGFALDVRRDLRARVTKDIDIDYGDSAEETRRDLQAAAVADLDDFFEFQIEQVEVGEQVAPGGGLRYRATAYLGGREFEIVPIDVGFQDALADNPETLSGPSLLNFADIRPASIPTAPLTQHLAEKLHAYTRAYGVAEASSRPKDLIDILLIADMAELKMSVLREAIERTFRARDTHSMPLALPAPPADWARPYRRLAEEVAFSPELTEGFREASAFLDPVLADDMTEAQWTPAEGHWIPLSAAKEEKR